MSKEKRSNKKNLDLDLDDISGGKKSSILETKEDMFFKRNPLVSKPEKRNTKYSYMLTFPTNDLEKFISKDILDCTGEEFLAWAGIMHPYVSRPARDFDSKENRIRAFNQIIDFHRSGLSWLRSNKLKKENVFH